MSDRHVLCPDCQAGNPVVPALDRLFRCPECGLHWKYGVSYMRVTTANRDLIEVVGDALDQAREDRRDV